MRKFAYWCIAVNITLFLSIYQRMTGPTHPKKVDIELNGESRQIKLPRSGVQHDEIITLEDVNHGDSPHDLRSASITGTVPMIHYRRYPTTEAYYRRLRVERQRVAGGFARTTRCWQAAVLHHRWRKGLSEG